MPSLFKSVTWHWGNVLTLILPFQRLIRVIFLAVTFAILVGCVKPWRKARKFVWNSFFQDLRILLAVVKIYLRHLSEVTFLECKDCLRKSLHSARKHARIFVRGHHQFRDVRSLYEIEAQVKLWASSWTNNIQGEIYEHLFSPNRGYWVYYPLAILLQRVGKMFTNNVVFATRG